MLRGLGLRDHVRELMADDGLRVEWFAERLALVDPLQALLDDEAHVARRRATHTPALVVEVAQNDEDASTLGPERVLDGHFDVLEGDVSRASRSGVGGLDRLRLHTLPTLNENHSETAVGLAAHSEAERKLRSLPAVSALAR